MIVFEEEVREIVKILPAHTEPKSPTGFTVWPIRYDWGTYEVLTKFLLLKENASKYPLLWMITDPTNGNKERTHATRKAKFVLATSSNNPDGFNEFQYHNDFLKVLIPVYDNILTAFIKSGRFSIKSDILPYNLEPNFSVKKNGKTPIAIWNAISFTIDISIDNRKCLNKNIKF